jgi:hypothetical protein
MYKKDDRWWTEINGITTSVGTGSRIELIFYKMQYNLRKVIAPVFCLAVGHTWSGDFDYRCRVCNKPYKETR